MASSPVGKQAVVATPGGFRGLKFGMALTRLAGLTVEVQHLLKPRSVYRYDPALVRVISAIMAPCEVSAPGLSADAVRAWRGSWSGRRLWERYRFPRL